jgi:nitroimidazol reductase NimA-like FMN-containing flavoprotein (pyridoxamine 5'-phosphate oxidase superfamily)
MRPLSVEERERFLAEPRVAVLSVASDDDRPPLTVPVWYAYRPGGRITILTGTQGRRARKTRLLERPACSA